MLKLRRVSSDNAGMAWDYERRVGQRYPAAVGLRWHVHGQWGRRRQHAMIVNISLSGARIRARVDDAIAIGSLVDIKVRNGRGVVEVRRIDISHDPTMAHYGVRFVELDVRLKDLVLELTRPNPNTI